VRYAGFWIRLAAGLIDAVVFLPFTALHFWAQSVSWEAAVAGAVVFSYVYAAYNIYCHGRWGQTLGKMALGIRVQLAGGGRITWRAAFLRHCVDLGFSIWTSIVYVGAILAVDAQAYESLDWIGRAEVIAGALPWWYGWTNRLWAVWSASELVVLLTNRRRRALHDFIAGTVVVHVDRSP